MCGISGFIGHGNQSTLKKMTDTLSHRGPDAEGFWSEPLTGVYLGHRRLSIVDLSCGQQPMTNQDESIIIVFNGEIYNYLELRDELKALGFVFKSHHSDTEVLIHGYQAWGSKLPSKLNGMWSFAIYDKIHGKLFCSRDRFGKKPFFYTRQNGTFAFASELSALTRHPQVRAALSKTALKKYFGYGYIPAPSTIYEQIYKLPGGHSLTVDLPTGQFRIEKYWEFVIEPMDKIPQNPEQVWGEELRGLIDKAVKRRLMSDVPLGAFLSGGIDSSTVAAYAVKNLGNSKLKTFSIGFDVDDFDETQYSFQMAKLLDTDHCMERLSIETAKELLPEIMAKLDEPMGDSSILPTFLLCQHTRKYVTVALGGDGADELFAGYDPFRALKWAEQYQKLIPKPLHQGIRMVFSRMPVSHGYMSLDFKIKRTLRGLSYPDKLWLPVWMATLDADEMQDLFSEPVDIEEVFSEAIAYWDSCKSSDIYNKTMEFYVKLYLQDDVLVKVDRASMMNSLEVRAPFLDIELVDFIRKIPSSYKFRDGQTKYILKKALEPVLPANILYRSKQGFGVPIGKWFKDGVFSFPDVSPSAYLNGDFTTGKLADHKKGISDQRAFLWNHWVLSNFLQKCEIVG